MNQETYEALNLLMGYVKGHTAENINEIMILADDSENPKGFTLKAVINQIDGWIDEVAKDYTD